MVAPNTEECGLTPFQYVLVYAQNFPKWCLSFPFVSVNNSLVFGAGNFCNEEQKEKYLQPII